MSLNHLALQRADLAAVLAVVAVVAHHEIFPLRHRERPKVRLVGRHIELLLNVLAVHIQFAFSQQDRFARQTDHALDAIHAVVRVRVIADHDIKPLRVAHQIIKLRRDHKFAVFQRVEHRAAVHANRLKDERAHDERQRRRHNENHHPFKNLALQALFGLLLFLLVLLFLLHEKLRLVSLNF